MRRGNIKVILIIVLLLATAGVLATVINLNRDRGAKAPENALTYKVFRGDFVDSVNEAGEIESSSNIEIRCEVKSQGKAGTAILELVPEGTIVKEGDFLCQLDDSILKEQLTEQKIVVAQDRARVIQSRSDLDTAERILNEYKNGTFEQERAGFEAAVKVAQEAFERSQQFRQHSGKLSRKGYITKTQFAADKFAEAKAELDLKLARQNLEVYNKFTQDRLVAQYEAEIEKQEANAEAAQFTLELSQSKEKEKAQQIAACRVVAPAPGMVVYANETDRRGDASFVIEEGAILRDTQPIFRLPDPTKMQVKTKVNDSKINKIAEGQDALIRVDTDPEKPVRGVIRKVSAFPEPRRWYQAPIEYTVFVDITEESPLIRSGLRGKVEMFVERVPDVVQAPVSSVIRRNDKFYVLVLNSDRFEAREVTVGSNNEKFAVIESGLKVDDEVLIDPESYLDDIELPNESS